MGTRTRLAAALRYLEADAGPADREVVLTWIAAGIAGVVVLCLIGGSSRQAAPPPNTPEARGLLEADLQQAIATGRKIDTIKAYRHLHGTDLKDSKDAIERAMTGLA